MAGQPITWSDSTTESADASIDSDTFQTEGSIGFSLSIGVTGAAPSGISGNLQLIVSNTDVDADYAPIGLMQAVRLNSGQTQAFVFSAETFFFAYAKLRWVQAGPQDSGTLGTGAWNLTLQLGAELGGGFLELNGTSWPVSTDGAAPTLDEVGYKQRAVDGSMTRTARAAKRTFKLKTIPLSPSDATAFKNLLVGYGNGNHWSFDVDAVFLYSDKGLPGASAGGTVTWKHSAPTPKFGNGCIEISSGGSVEFDQAIVPITGLNDLDEITPYPYSAVVWVWNGARWDGYAWSYDGAVYKVFKNGAAIGAALPGFAAVDVDGNFYLFGRSLIGSDQIMYFDDLVVLPYLARPQDLQIWSEASEAFSALPVLTPSGDVFEAPVPTAVQGSVTDIKEMIVNTGDGNGLYQNAQQITFLLEEV